MRALYNRFGTLGSFLVIGILFCATTAIAAVVVGQSTTGVSNIVTYTQLTLSKPTDATVGDLLLANITFQGGSSLPVTTPEGWTPITKTTNSNDISIASYYKIAAANEPSTYIWSLATATKAVGGITRFSGVDATNPVDVFAGLTGKGKAVIAPSVTTTAAGDQIVTLFATEWSVGNGGIFSAPSGMTESYDISHRILGPSAALDTVVQPNIGATGQKTANISTPLKPNWAAQTISFRKAPLIPQPISFGAITQSSSTSYDVTVSGTNRLIVLYITSETPARCSATYDGAGLTFQAIQQFGSGPNWLQVLTLTNPILGTHTLSISNCVPLVSATLSYNGVSQAGQPEVLAQQGATASGSSIVNSISITKNDAWVIAGFGNYAGSPLSYTNVIQRGSSLSNGLDIGDSNGPVTIGVYNQGASWLSGTNEMAVIQMVIAPAE